MCVLVFRTVHANIIIWTVKQVKAGKSKQEKNKGEDIL